MNTTLPSGPHSLTAAFIPTGSSFAPSISATTSYLVNPASTTTTLGLTVSPAPLGTTETLTATVTPPAAGSIQFKDGTTTIGNPVTLTNGSAAMTTTLASGTHSLTAVFTPTDLTKFGSSTSNTVSYVVNAPTRNPTMTRLTVFPRHAFQHIPVVLLANVTPRYAAGTIQFMDGPTALDAPTPVVGGFAWSVTPLSAGTHSLTAVFTLTDAAAFDPSTSQPTPVTVNQLFSIGDS